MKSKLIVLSSMLILAALLLGACAPAAPAAEAPAAEEPAAEEAPAEEAAKEPIVFKLGMVGPFSGPSARIGTEMKDGALMAFEAVDYMVGDYKVEFVFVDSQSDPAKATQAYEQAIVQDGIQAGLLNWHSSVAVALMEVTAKYKIPHILGTGSTDIINQKYASDPEKYGYWTMKSWPIPSRMTVMYVEALEQAIEDGTFAPEEKTVVIYAEDTDLGRTVGNGFRDQFEAVGWTVLAQEYFPLGQTEFYPLLNKFKDLNPAVMAGTCTAPPSLAAIIKQSEEIGLKSVHISDGVGWIGGWYELIGKSSDFVLDQIPKFGSEKGKAFAKAFEEKYGYEPSASTGGIGYDAANIWIEIAKAVQAKGEELNSETIYNFIQEEIMTGNWTYTDGIVMKEWKWDMSTPPDPVLGRDYFIFPILQYFDGESFIVYPPDWADQPVKFRE